MSLDLIAGQILGLFLDALVQNLSGLSREEPMPYPDMTLCSNVIKKGTASWFSLETHPWKKEIG